MLSILDNHCIHNDEVTLNSRLAYLYIYVDHNREIVVTSNGDSDGFSVVLNHASILFGPNPNGLSSS